VVLAEITDLANCSKHLLFKKMVKTDAGASAFISVSLLHTKLITQLNFNITV